MNHSKLVRKTFSHQEMVQMAKHVKIRGNNSCIYAGWGRNSYPKALIFYMMTIDKCSQTPSFCGMGPQQLTSAGCFADNFWQHVSNWRRYISIVIGWSHGKNSECVYPSLGSLSHRDQNLLWVQFGFGLVFRWFHFIVSLSCLLPDVIQQTFFINPKDPMQNYTVLHKIGLPAAG